MLVANPSSIVLMLPKSALLTQINVHRYHYPHQAIGNIMNVVLVSTLYNHVMQTKGVRL